jgi:hypothetical protein
MCGACRKHGGNRQLETLIRVLEINVRIDYLYVLQVCMESVGIGQSPMSLFSSVDQKYIHTIQTVSKYLEYFFRQRSITKPKSSNEGTVVFILSIQTPSRFVHRYMFRLEVLSYLLRISSAGSLREASAIPSSKFRNRAT